MEWAWITAPIFSLVFAGILLSFAGNLYSAKLSRAFNGFVIQDLDTGLNAQWVKASFFFPRGGSYDLTLANTDQVVSADFFSMAGYGYSRYGGRYAERAGASVPVLDLGHAALPSVDVSNLAFREFTYHRVSTPPIEIVIDVRTAGGGLQGEVVNNSNLTLRCVALVHKNTTYLIDDLAPKARYKLPHKPKTLASSPSLISGGRTSGQVALYAMTSNFDAGGPGDLSTSASKVVIVCTKELGGTK
jgi:hypothetical protein